MIWLLVLVYGYLVVVLLVNVLIVSDCCFNIECIEVIVCSFDWVGEYDYSIYDMCYVWVVEIVEVFDCSVILVVGKSVVIV